MTTTTRGWEAATRSKRLTLAWWSARIDCNSFDDARGSCGREHRLLFVEDRGSIGFDPDQRGGKRQAIGAGIETGSEVQHCIGVNGLNAVEDQLVEDLRADCERPGEPARSRVRPGHGRHPFGDPPPALPCQSSREGIDEQSVGALGFQGSVEGHPPRGVRDVLHEPRCRRAHAVPRDRMAARIKATGDWAG